MEKINYIKLYQLQDKVLSALNSYNNDLYLTGGTALNRFLIDENNRFSDDLDFFISKTTQDKTQREQIKQAFTCLNENFTIKIESSSEDFNRVIIIENNTKLQVDIINDPVPYFGETINRNGISLDNINNLLSNKISAIMSRDEEKDIFDIYLINEKKGPINWWEIISEAQEKEHFQSTDFIARLKSFPVSLLDNIKTQNLDYIKKIKEDYENFVDTIEISAFTPNETQSKEEQEDLIRNFNNKNINMVQTTTLKT